MKKEYNQLYNSVFADAADSRKSWEKILESEKQILRLSLLGRELSEKRSEVK